MLKGSMFITVFIVGYVASITPVSARECGKGLLSKLGCAVDPTNPAENGGGVSNFNNYYTVGAIMAAKASGEIKSYQHCIDLVNRISQAAKERTSFLSPVIVKAIESDKKAGIGTCVREFSKSSQNSNQSTDAPNSPSQKQDTIFTGS
jgi:hypothetical protein